MFLLSEKKVEPMSVVVDTERGSCNEYKSWAIWMRSSWCPSRLAPALGGGGNRLSERNFSFRERERETTTTTGIRGGNHLLWALESRRRGGKKKEKKKSRHWRRPWSLVSSLLISACLLLTRRHECPPTCISLLAVLPKEQVMVESMITTTTLSCSFVVFLDQRQYRPAILARIHYFLRLGWNRFRQANHSQWSRHFCTFFYLVWNCNGLDCSAFISVPSNCQMRDGSYALLPWGKNSRNLPFFCFFFPRREGALVSFRTASFPIRGAPFFFFLRLIFR